MKILLLSIVLFLVLTLGVSTTAYAHVLVNDSTNKTTAILHINPDDEPIAGKSSTLYFDIQDTLRRQLESAGLEITNSNGEITRVQTTVSNSLVTARYTFPAQGAYKLNFIVQTKGQRYIFTQNQRVFGGISNGRTRKPHHQWAEPLFFASVLSSGVLAIIAFNRRSSIRRQSTL